MASCVLDEVDLAGRACPCASGFVCDERSQRCIRPDPETGDGDSDAGISDAGLRSCRVDRDCLNPPTEICFGGFCRPGCDRPAGILCPEPLACDTASGHCLSTQSCLTQFDCGPPISICVTGRCEKGCGVSTAPCRLDRVCDPASGFCVGTSSCAADADCPSGYWCDGRSCRQGCNEPGAPSCRGESTCSEQTGRCEGAADLGESCTGNLTCASGLCLGLMSEGETNFICSRTCGATNECPLGATCLPVSTAGHCLPARLLGTNTNLSLRSGASCDPTMNACQSGACEAATCIERCSRDRDCLAFGGTCVAVRQDLSGGRRVRLPRCVAPFIGMGVGAACQVNEDCARGVCDPSARKCAKLCCGEADCSASQSCLPVAVDDSVLRICRTRTSTGARPLGAACDRNGDCESEMCGPSDENNPGGAKICSTYCCSDPDCDVLSSSGRCVARDGPLPDTVIGRCVPQ